MSLSMTDQEVILQILVEKAQNGDQDALNKILIILEPDIKKLAIKFYISGSDENDVIQECRIGVVKAIRDYDINGGMSFKNFTINLCCKRHVITAISHANRKKFDLQNNSVSLDAPVLTNDDDLQQTLADFIPDDNYDLLNDLIIRDEYEEYYTQMQNKLTPLERDIFDQYTLNESYKDIAEAAGCKIKTVDNALVRIKKKASIIYDDYNFMFGEVYTGINTSPEARKFLF